MCSYLGGDCANNFAVRIEACNLRVKHNRWIEGDVFLLLFYNSVILWF